MSERRDEMRRAVGEDGTPRAHSGSDAARRSANSLREHVDQHQPLEVGSPEHQAFEREIQDEQAAADVEREGDDFDMVQGIHVAHPSTPNINFLPSPIYTDQRLPVGTVWFKTDDKPIEEFIREILAAVEPGSNELPPSFMDMVGERNTKLMTGPQAAAAIRASVPQIEALQEVRRRQAERMANDPAAAIGHTEQAQPVDHGSEGMHDKLIEEIRHRRDVGLARYNSTLQAFNGRDALRDILDELLDASVYVLQAQTERDRLKDQLREALCAQLIVDPTGIEAERIEAALQEVFGG